MALLRFSGKATSAIVRNQVSGRNPLRFQDVLLKQQFSWLASGSVTVYRRDYHSSSSRDKTDGGTEQQQQQQIFSHHRGLASSSTASPPRDPLNTGFADPVAAFKSKTLLELIRAYAVYMICSSSYLVENNMQVIDLRKSLIEEQLDTGLICVIQSRRSLIIVNERLVM